MVSQQLESPIHLITKLPIGEVGFWFRVQKIEEYVLI